MRPSIRAGEAPALLRVNGLCGCWSTGAAQAERVVCAPQDPWIPACAGMTVGWVCDPSRALTSPQSEEAADGVYDFGVLGGGEGLSRVRLLDVTWLTHSLQIAEVVGSTLGFRLNMIDRGLFHR